MHMFMMLLFSVVSTKAWLPPLLLTSLLLLMIFIAMTRTLFPNLYQPFALEFIDNLPLALLQPQASSTWEVLTSRVRVSIITLVHMTVEAK